MTDLLAEQHKEAGTASGVSGPLRYPDTCVLWIQAEQKGKLHEPLVLCPVGYGRDSLFHHGLLCEGMNVNYYIVYMRLATSLCTWNLDVLQNILTYQLGTHHLLDKTQLAFDFQMAILDLKVTEIKYRKCRNKRPSVY